MLIVCSFSILLQMEKSDAYRKGSGASKKWDAGGTGGPGGGPYSGGPRGPPRGLDNVRGIDHSKSRPVPTPERKNILYFFFRLCHFFFPLNSSLLILRFSSCLWLLLWVRCQRYQHYCHHC